MIDYYKELKIEQAKNLEEINMELSKLESIWKRREITNPEKAASVITIIYEARKVFASEHTRKVYDRELENNRVPEQSAEEQRLQSMQKWLKQATDFYDENEYDLAMTALERAYVYVPQECEDSEFFCLAARIYKSCKKYDEAISNINKAIIVDPDYAYYYLIKGEVYIQFALECRSTDADKFNENIERGRKTLKTAITNAERSDDNDIEATAMGVLAFLWNNIPPSDPVKAVELAYKALSIGTDLWGNSQKIVGDAQAKQKLKEEQELTNTWEKYVKAVKMMESGFHEEASKCFKELGNYKDSEELAKKCLIEISDHENQRKNNIYNSAVNYMKKQGVDYIRTAYDQFKSISGWKDADEMALECKRMMEIQYESSTQDSLQDTSTQRAMWRLKGLCQYCGGDFSGIINKTCRNCGRGKDY